MQVFIYKKIANVLRVGIFISDMFNVICVTNN